MVKPEITTLEGGPLDAALFPEVAINPEQPFEPGEIPEVIPLLIGLRRHILAKRIETTEKKIEQSKRDHEVIHFVGKSIIQGEGYLAVNKDNMLRPTSKYQRSAAQKLEKLTTERRIKQAHVHNIAVSYPNPNVEHVEVVQHDRFDLFPDHLSGAPQKRSERYTVNQNVRSHMGGKREIHHLDKNFANVIAEPARKINKLRSKRNKLLLRQLALEKTAEDKATRRGEVSTEGS